MTYRVLVIGLLAGQDHTDLTTRSFYQAGYRRTQLQKRGLVAEVRTGSGRLVIDAMGDERR